MPVCNSSVRCRWLYPISPDTNVLPAPQPLGSDTAGAVGATTDYFFLSGCRCGPPWPHRCLHARPAVCQCG